MKTSALLLAALATLAAASPFRPFRVPTTTEVPPRDVA